MPDCSLLTLTGMQTPAQSRGGSLHPPQSLLEGIPSPPKNSEMRPASKKGSDIGGMMLGIMFWEEAFYQTIASKKWMCYFHTLQPLEIQALHNLQHHQKHHLNDENSGVEDAFSVKEPYLRESTNV